MDNLTPITREEMLMNDEPLTPITREEKILAGEDLNPVTRREYFLKKYRHAGGDVMVEGLEVTANGTYTAPEGKAYSPVEVDVPLPENAYLLKTASGSLVSFSDGADLPMPSFICNIDAVQDLHGYDAPWVGGAGKNKLPMTVDGIKTANGGSNTWTNNEKTISGITFTILTNSDGEIIGVKVNGTATADAVVTILVDTSEVYGDLYFVGCDGGSNNTYNALMWDATTNARAKKWDGTTASANSIDGTFQQVKIVQGNNVKFQLRVMNGQTVNNVIFQPMICLSTETDPTFAPYSNICPISGHTGVDAVISPTTEASAGTTYSVSWQTEAGEVFDGYVDLVSGVLTVTHKSQTGFTRGSQDSTNKLYSIGFPADMKRHLDGTISPYFIDNMFEKKSLANARASETPSITQYNNVLYVGGCIGKEAELDTLLETLQVKYELETPLTYQLTPTQIKSLKDDITNAWCSTGDVNVDYFAKEVEG